MAYNPSYFLVLYPLVRGSLVFRELCLPSKKHGKFFFFLKKQRGAFFFLSLFSGLVLSTSAVFEVMYGVLFHEGSDTIKPATLAAGWIFCGFHTGLRKTSIRFCYEDGILGRPCMQ